MRDPINLFEELCIRLIGENFHLPAYFLSTLFCFPIAEYFWYKRKILRIFSAIFFFLGVLSFIKISWLFFLILSVSGRILNLLYTAIVRYEPVDIAVERNLRSVAKLPLYLAFLYQELCKKIFGDWYKPIFFLSTAYLLPAALRLWNRKKRVVKGISFFVAVFYGILFFNGWWVFILIFFILGAFLKFLAFLYRHFRVEEKETMEIEIERLDRIDIVSVGLILFIFVSFIFNWYKFVPNCVDTWYHLAVGRKILELGTIPVWDSWEFAPAGRPHLYPPVLHLLIALCAGAENNVVNGGRVLQAIFYPLALFTNWLFVRYLLDKKIAFLALIFLSMDIGFLMINTMILPSMLVNILLPLLLICFLKKKFILSVFLMTLCLYSHLSFPFIILFCLFLFSVKYEYMDFYKKFATFSLILYLPWFLRILGNFNALESTVQTFSSPVHLLFGFLSLQFVNPILISLGIVGYRKAGESYKLVKMFLLGSLPILLLYGGRYWFHTMPFWAIMIASFAKKYLRSKKSVALFVIIGLIPTVDVVLFDDFGVIPSITGGDAALMMWTNGVVFDPLYGEDCEELAEYIMETTEKNAIIRADEPWVGDMIVALTGRRVTTGAWWEVSSVEEKAEDIKIYVSLEPISDCTIGRFYILKVS
ncbi:MAG: hypothetical protein U9N35_01690 [Euryarchaeota archaeon]|nr:hypothetical protein [Euryarchaeota archaeon]